MRVTAILTQTERNRLDRSVQTAEKHPSDLMLTPLHRLSRPKTCSCASTAAIPSKKRLLRRHGQAKLNQMGGHLGNVGLGFVSHFS